MVNIDDFNSLLNYQPMMKVTRKENGDYIVEGNYNLSCSYKDVYLQGEYDITIKIPKEYPEQLPQVFDFNNVIPKEFEHFYVDGSLCLGSPIELYLSTLENEISEFLIKHIDAYLFSCTYFIKYNYEFPYGERSHGLIGILEFWKEYLNLNDYGSIYNVMNYISKDNYRGHDLCPCGSKEKLRNCHGNKILLIIKNSLSNVVKGEFILFEKEVKKLIE